MRHSVRALIPPAFLRTYYDWRRRQWMAARRAARAKATCYTQAQFKALLAQLGIVPGDALMVHSALGEFNNVEGGAAGVLQALREYLGDNGTLMVPTFPHWATVMATMPEFDVEHTVSCTGYLCELVRLHPDAYRSIHPTHSVAALGPLAREFTQSHHLDPQPFGLSSPFYKHAQAGGKILLLGVTVNSMTSFHIYEDLLGRHPWFLPYEEVPLRFRICHRGVRSEYVGYVYALALAQQRDVTRLQPAFEAHASMQTITTDHSTLSVLHAAQMVKVCLSELLEGRSAYHGLVVPEAAKAEISEVLHKHYL